MKATHRKYSLKSPMPFWRTIRISLSQIESVYGHGNFDDAGDALVYALCDISGLMNVERYCQIDIDCNHENPWFHAVIFQVADLSDEEFEMLISRIRVLKLWDDGFQKTE